MPFQISFAPQVREHLRSLSAHDQQVVLDEIERQLSYEPTVETRHRKRLRPNPVAPWQLSVSDFRILYDVDDARQMVEILVVGRKVHEKLFVAGKEVKL